MKNKHIIILLLAFIISGICSCKKIIEIDTPQNQLTTDKVFADTTSAIAAMVNVYALFDRTIDVNYNKFLGLYTDEFIFPGNPSDQFYTSNLKTDNSTVLNIWKNYYFTIYSCNAIIEQLSSTQTIPKATAVQLSAEAKFIRAYSYFYLVNLYGKVPLLTNTNVAKTANAGRTDVQEIYRQIMADLKDAQRDLPSAYSDGEKIRAVKAAATAMLARVYLFQQDWNEAETNASILINSGQYTPLDNPSTVFYANSKEGILQIWTQFGYISDGTSLIPGSGLPQFPISDNLVNSFESGDLRKNLWLKSTVVNGKTFYYAYKYHNRNSVVEQPEYLVTLRISEQYLIRAAARLQLGKVTEAIADINVIRKRAGLPDLSSTLSLSDAQAAVEKEWRVEYFGEWGTRFLMLKQTGKLNQVMSAYRATWTPKAALLPIPQNEITLDSQLEQNPGY